MPVHDQSLEVQPWRVPVHWLVRVQVLAVPVRARVQRVLQQVEAELESLLGVRQEVSVLVKKSPEPSSPETSEEQPWSHPSRRMHLLCALQAHAELIESRLLELALVLLVLERVLLERVPVQEAQEAQIVALLVVPQELGSELVQARARVRVLVEE